MGRLLTIKKVEEFRAQTRKLVNELAQNTEGHFTPQDMEEIWDAADMALVGTQDKQTASIVRQETLMEVGKWLESNICCMFAGNDIAANADINCKLQDSLVAYSLLPFQQFLESLLRGEMPENGRVQANDRG